MKINLSKLKHVVHQDDGKIVAQCPACAIEGGDAKGEHLVIFLDGKFGCVVYPKDKAHNRKIMELASNDGGSGYRLTINRVQVADSVVIMNLGRLGRPFSSPKESKSKNDLSIDTSLNPPEVENRRPKRPELDTPHTDDIPAESNPMLRSRTPPVRPQPVARPYITDSDDPTLIEHNEAMTRNGCMGGGLGYSPTDEEINAFLGRN